MRQVRVALAAFAVAVTVFHGSLLSAAEGSQPPTVDDLLARLGYAEQDKKDLLAGKVIATDVKRTQDDQLIAAVAVLLPVTIADLAQGPTRGRNIERDP